MKKNLFIAIFLAFTCFFCSAQNKNEVTILYLLPFHLTESSPKISSFRNSADINQVKQFEMMGFWLGAKMALQEFEHSDIKINVIVRDAVREKSSLDIIFNDDSLMENVNIIIGPFYGALFPEAAAYAQNNNILIVNPFSTRFDFVQHNPNVYKLTPPFLSRPEALSRLLLSQFGDYNIILWGDSVPSPEMQAYKYYFNEHDIQYKETHSFSLPIQAKNRNFIIAFFEKDTRVIHGVHTLINNENQENMILIAPEKWFSIVELNEDFYKLPNLYYFTNYFVDENSGNVKQFKNDYKYHFNSPSELTDYTFQGYDITRYFIDLYLADFDINKVQFQPLSYKFKWDKISEGGFENIKTRLIQVKDLEVEEVE